MDPHEHHQHANASNSSHSEVGLDGRDSVQDPVCGMQVLPATAAGSLEHDGRTYYFCSRHCLEKFRSDPGRFTAEARGRGGSDHGFIVISPTLPPKPAPPGTTYTCPMHPEIVRDRPGACPICGMALEPVAVLTEEEPEDPELVDMTRRFWICLALTIPLLLLSMAEMIPGFALPTWLGGRTWVGIQFALASPVVLWGGLPFFQRGWSSLVGRRLNMFTLIALGTGSAFVFSALAAIAPGLFPASFRGHHGEVAVYFEPAAVITTLVLLGQVLELRARRQTGSAIRALLGLAPGGRGDCATTAWRKTSRSTRSSRTIGCGSGRGRRFRSTAR